MENKLEELNKILKVIQSRNELLTEEIKRNEESIKSIENEISSILDGTIDSSMESSNVNVKNNVNMCYNK
jgi:septal ring factor EnvC (AmiA/AmiB activator)